jgi:hypothetical protein
LKSRTAADIAEFEHPEQGLTLQNFLTFHRAQSQFLLFVFFSFAFRICSLRGFPFKRPADLFRIYINVLICCIHQFGLVFVDVLLFSFQCISSVVETDEEFW